jgi:ribonuclease P protein component
MKDSLYRLSRRERIRKRRDFLLAQERGYRFVCDTMIVLLRKNDYGCNRLGITASKKVGNAVKRNRVKRWVREVFRYMKRELDGGIDLVVIARRTAPESGLKKIKDDLHSVLLRKRRKKDLTKYQSQEKTSDL